MKHLRILALALALLLLGLLCACGREEPQLPAEDAPAEAGPEAVPAQAEDEPASAVAIVDAGRSFRLQYRDSPRENLSGIVLYAQPLAESVVLTSMSYREDGSCMAVSAEWTRDGQTGRAIPLEENAWIDAAWSAEAQDYYVISTGQDGAFTQTIAIAPGGEAALTDLLGTDTAVEWLFGTEDALLLLTPDGQMLAFDFSGGLLWSQDFDCEIAGAVQTESGRIILEELREEGEAPLFRLLDPETRTLLPVCAVPEALWDAEFLSGEKWGYDILAYDDSYLYGWTFRSPALDRLASFDALGLDAARISVLACLDGTVLIGACSSTDGTADRIIFIEEGEAADKQLTLTVAGLSRPMAVTAAMADFGQMYPEYRVEYVDYQELYGDQALTRLALDLQYGSCPDLLFLNAVPYEAYARRGLLTDLDAYLDGTNELAREDILPNLLQALETADGALYRLPQSFSVRTAVALRSVVGERTSWTFEEFQAVLDSLPEDCGVLASRDPDAILRDVLFASFSRFVDYETGQAHFDGGVFAQWLSLIQEIQNRPLPEQDDSLTALLDQSLLLIPVTLSRASAYEELDTRLGGGQVFTGYPDGAAASFYLINPMAIPANAAHGDAAWQFMQMLLTSEYYAMGTPLIVEDQVERALAQEVEDGVKQENADAMLALIRSIGQTVYYDEAVTAIVLDEAEAFWNGTRSAEQTAALIQDRVQLYLDEG